MDTRTTTIGRIFELDHKAEYILSELEVYKKKNKADNELLQYEYDLYRAIEKKEACNLIEVPSNEIENKPHSLILLPHILKKIPDSFDDIAQGIKEPIKNGIKSINNSLKLKKNIISLALQIKGIISIVLGLAAMIVYAIEIYDTYNEIKNIIAEIKQLLNEYNEKIKDKNKEEINELNQHMTAKRNQLLSRLAMAIFQMGILLLGKIAAITLLTFGILIITGLAAAFIAIAVSVTTFLGVITAGFLTAKYFLNLLTNGDALHLARKFEEKPRQDVADEFQKDPKEAFEYTDLLEKLDILNKIRKEIEEYKEDARSKVSGILEKLEKIKKTGKGKLNKTEKKLYKEYYTDISTEDYITIISQKYPDAYHQIENEKNLLDEINKTETAINNFKGDDFQYKLSKYRERRKEKIEAEHKFTFNFIEFASSLTTLIGIVTLNPPIIYTGISIGMASKILEFVDGRNENGPTSYLREKFSSLGTKIADFFAPKRETTDNTMLTYPPKIEEKHAGAPPCRTQPIPITTKTTKTTNQINKLLSQASSVPVAEKKHTGSISQESVITINTSKSYKTTSTYTQSTFSKKYSREPVNRSSSGRIKTQPLIIGCSSSS